MITFAAAIAKTSGHLLAPTLLYHLEDGLALLQTVPEDHAVRKDIVRGIITSRIRCRANGIPATLVAINNL